MAEEPALERLKALSDQLFDPELYKQVLDSLPVAMLIIDSDQKIQMVNNQLELMFGYPRTALLGKDMGMLLPETLRNVHMSHVRKFFDEPHIRPHSSYAPHRRPMNLGAALPGLRRDGKVIKLQISLGPLVNEYGTWALAVLSKATDDG